MFHKMIEVYDITRLFSGLMEADVSKALKNREVV